MKASSKRIVFLLTLLMVLQIILSTPVAVEASQNLKITKVQTTTSLSWQSYFSDGMMLVYKSVGDYYYVNKAGKVDKLHPNIVGVRFSDGLAPIYDKNKGLGYIDTRGKIVIPMGLNALTDNNGELLSVGSFVNGYALVYNGSTYDGNPYQQNLWYTIDKTGKKVDVELSTDSLTIALGGYPHDRDFETVVINGAETRVFFNEGLGLASTGDGLDFWVVEKLDYTPPAPKPQAEPLKEEVIYYSNLSTLSFTSWKPWDSGTTLNYKLINNSKEVDHGAYAVIILSTGKDTKENLWESSTTSRYANNDYYPLEGHIFEYTAQSGEIINGMLWSQLGGEQNVSEEDLGKGELKYIVIKLRSKKEKDQLQGEFDSIGLGVYNFFSRDENTIMQNWLRRTFGITKGVNLYEEFN